MLKKRSFTLAEIIIVIGVIGTLAVLTLSYSRPHEKMNNIEFKYKYPNILSSLDSAWYTENMNLKRANRVLPRTASGACEILAPYFSPISSNCNSASIIATSANDLPNNAKGFTTKNGMQIYFMEAFLIRQNGLNWVFDANTNNINTNDILILPIFVDINGAGNAAENQPNSWIYSAQRDPDIFAFAALSNGQIVPMGAPEFNPKYLQVRIRFIQNDRYNFTNTLSSYNKALNDAWGINPADGTIIRSRNVGFSHSKMIRLAIMASDAGNLLKGVYTNYIAENMGNRTIPECEVGGFNKCCPVIEVFRK